mgnify:CR=1 FL=1
MRKTDAFRRAAALVAALSITVSLAAPAFAETYYYIDDGDITITKDENGQTVKQGNKEAENIGADEEIIITTHKEATTTLESDLEGPAAEDSGFGPVVEDNYQPAPPAQPEDAEEPKDADQPEDDDQKNAEESENDEEQKDADRQENTDRKESAEEPEDADRKESAGQQAQPQQAAPAAAPAASTPANGFCKNIITVINNAATALKLTLKDVKIDVSDTGLENHAGKAALSVQGDGNVTIELDGNNELKSGNLKAGLEKNTSEGTLTLKDDKEAGSGSLTAEGGGWAAGIGGSDGKGTNNIIISGGTVTAEGGNYGAGIGSGGGSYDGGDHITITGGTVNATGGAWGAGIGGGYGDDSDHITITGGTVNATGGDNGAGIGGGYGGVGDHITIGGGAVTAEGGENGAGIGGGYSGVGDHITITGGKVTAEGGISGAGIGGGYRGRGRNITVSGAAQVTAVAGKSDEDNFSGFGATIGDGYNGGDTRDDDGNLISYGSGKEVQADISGLTTTGYIRHMIYNEDGSVKQEWWEYGHLQPDPDTTENPNAPAEGSNGVSLGTPGLHVETLEGSPLPFNAQRQGRTLTVRADTLAARLHGTRQALEALQEQGVEQIQFVTSFKTTTLSVEDLLAEGGSWFALEHNGLGSRRLSAAQAESLKCWMH